jgi:hypothetical protein
MQKREFPVLDSIDEQEPMCEELVMEIASMSNEAYQRLCEERLDAEVREIVKHYQDSASEAWKYPVRGGGTGIPTNY